MIRGVYLEPPYTKEELAYLERGLYATPVAATRRREPPQPAAEPPQAGAVLPDAERALRLGNPPRSLAAA